MANGTAAGLCRLTVRAPSKAIDLAVPSDVPVADLLPAVLGYGGDDLGEAGLEHEGWVLQRLGEAPLDHEATLESLGLRDGDTVYLRPRTEALPEVRLDDIVDGISTTMKESPHGWSPQASRRLLRGLTLAALIGALVIIALPGGPAVQREITAGAFALLLLAGAAAASRAVGDAAAAALLGAMVSPYLVLAGWLLPGGALVGPDHYRTLGARLLAASAAEAGGSVLALAVVAAYTAFFVGATVFAIAGALGGTLLMVANMPPGHAASIVALVAVAFGAFVPSLSFRLSGLRTPPLPTNADQLQEGIEPRSPSAVAARAVLADTWMTALYATAGLTCALCVTALARDGLLRPIADGRRGVPAPGAAQPGPGQRLAAAVPGRAGSLGRGDDGRRRGRRGRSGRPDAAWPSGWRRPPRRFSSADGSFRAMRLVPYWGRAAEILHSLVAVSLLPLALWVLGVYGELRAIG